MAENSFVHQTRNRLWWLPHEEQFKTVISLKWTKQFFEFWAIFSGVRLFDKKFPYDWNWGQIYEASFSEYRVQELATFLTFFQILDAIF